MLVLKKHILCYCLSIYLKYDFVKNLIKINSKDTSAATMDIAFTPFFGNLSYSSLYSLSFFRQLKMN